MSHVLREERTQRFYLKISNAVTNKMETEPYPAERREVIIDDLELDKK